MDLDILKREMWLRKMYLKLILPLKFPDILNIEPTNRCNLACTMCPRSFSSRSLTDLEWGLFEKLCSELQKHGPITRVFLQKDGEPLLHPRIVDMVESLKDARAARSISIITNGTLLSGEMFERLALAGLHDLIVSIDAVEADEYQALKGVNKFIDVVQNIQNAAMLKKKNNWKLPLIKARFVARAGCEKEIERFTHQWQNVVDMVDITPYHTWLGAVNDKRCYSTPERYPCSLLWYTGVVNADGAVSPCCIDYNQKGVFANVKERSLFEIWNGKELSHLRRQHLQGKYSETPICGPCEYWTIKENIGSWLRRKYGSPTG